MISYRKIQIVAVLLMLALGLFPTVTIAICDAVPAGTGGGGYGAPIPGGVFVAPALPVCACWCGHVNCCIPGVTYPKVPAPAQFLYDGKTCSCLSSKSGAAKPNSSALKNQAEVQKQLQKSAGGIGRQETCSQWANRAWEERGWGSPGASTEAMIETGKMVGYGGEGALKPGDLVLVESAYSQSGRHVVIYFGKGLVIHDPGLSGPATIASFGKYSGNIIGIIPAPY